MAPPAPPSNTPMAPSSHHEATNGPPWALSCFEPTNWPLMCQAAPWWPLYTFGWPLLIGASEQPLGAFGFPF